MAVFQAVLADLGEGFFVVRFRNGQRPAGGFIPVNGVFDSLTGKDEAPIHRLTTGECGNQSDAGRRRVLG